MRIKIITASFGLSSSLIINNLKEISDLDIDVHIYNDSNTPYRNLSLSSRLKGKIPKMLEWEKSESESEYDYYIWFDSKFIINEGVIAKMLEGINGYDMCLFKHPERSSIKDELDFMNRLMSNNNNYLLSRYSGEDMDEQVSKYLSDDKFIDNKLFSCGCFIYSKELVRNKEYNLMKEWFYHNVIYSIQDQLSLPYLLQKFKINYNTFDFNILNSDVMTHIG